MESTIRQGGSKPAEQFSFAFALALLIVVFGGAYLSRFHPSALTSQAAWVVAALLSLGCAWTLWRDDKPRGAGSVRRAIAVLVHAAVAFVMGWLSTYVMSAVLVEIGAPAYEVPAHIDAVHPVRRGKGCHHQLKLSSTYLPEPMTPCVSQRVWQKASAGDAARVIVAANAVGMLMVDIQFD